MDLSPEEAIPDEFVFRVGWIAVGWATVEYGLDEIIRDIFSHHSPASYLRRPERPASLKAKIGFLRQAFSQIPTLAIAAQHGGPLLDELNVLKHCRHDVLHGLIQGPGDEGYRLMRYRYEATGHVREIYAYTFDDLAAISRHISSLAERLSFFGDLITDDQSEEALRELAVGKPAIPVPKKKLVFDAG